MHRYPGRSLTLYLKDQPSAALAIGDEADLTPGLWLGRKSPGTPEGDFQPQTSIFLHKIGETNVPDRASTQCRPNSREKNHAAQKTGRHGLGLMRV